MRQYCGTVLCFVACVGVVHTCVVLLNRTMNASNDLPIRPTMRGHQRSLVESHLDLGLSKLPLSLHPAMIVSHGVAVALLAGLLCESEVSILSKYIDGVALVSSVLLRELSEMVQRLAG